MSQTKAQLVSPVGILTASGLIISGDATVTGSIKGSAQIGISSNSTYLGLSTQFNFVGSSINYDATSGITTISASITRGKVYYFANS